MTQSLYIASNAANTIFEAQTVHSNNLANLSTIGFKADLATFQATGSEDEGDGSLNSSGLENLSVDFNPGAIRQTGRSLDIAIKGDGFIAVQSADGTESYTRAGNLNFDETGVLTTRQGKPVLGNGGPIIVPRAQAVEIADDGTVSITPPGAANTLVVLDRIKFVNPDVEQMQKGEDGMYYFKGDTPPDADASVEVKSGALEMSNVNAVKEMTEIIALARQFEAQLKMMSSVEEVQTDTESLLTMNG